MPSELIWLVVVAGVLYGVVGIVVGRRSYRWNRRRDRSAQLSLLISMVAALGWPITVRFWDADWLMTGRRSWRGDR